MSKVKELKRLGKEIGITDWNKVELLDGYDTGGYYVDITLVEPDWNKEIVCVNLVTSKNKGEVDREKVGYEDALKEVRGE